VQVNNWKKKRKRSLKYLNGLYEFIQPNSRLGANQKLTIENKKLSSWWILVSFINSTTKVSTKTSALLRHDTGYVSKTAALRERTNHTMEQDTSQTTINISLQGNDGDQDSHHCVLHHAHLAPAHEPLTLGPGREATPGDRLLHHRSRL